MQISTLTQFTISDILPALIQETGLGGFYAENGSYGGGTWLRFPVNGEHSPSTRGKCVVYVKEGGLAYLRSG